METIKRFFGAMILCIFIVSGASAVPVMLNDVPDVYWYNGCSPTSAGMVMAYYDNRGYGNLVAGQAGDAGYGTNINNAIASAGHIADYTGADNTTNPHANDSLADFMGTSRDFLIALDDGGADLLKTPNDVYGMTIWYNWDHGGRFYADDYSAVGGYNGLSGLNGIAQYIDYKGYDLILDQSYNQKIDSLGLTYGFTYTEFQAEIDAGKPVLVHTENHTMAGVGYDSATGEIYVLDTWASTGTDAESFAWGGVYGGVDMVGVTVLTLAEQLIQEVPEPGMAALFCLAIFGAAFMRRKSV